MNKSDVVEIIISEIEDNAKKKAKKLNREIVQKQKDCERNLHKFVHKSLQAAIKISSKRQVFCLSSSGTCSVSCTISNKGSGTQQLNFTIKNPELGKLFAKAQAVEKEIDTTLYNSQTLKVKIMKELISTDKNGSDLLKKLRIKYIK